MTEKKNLTKIGIVCLLAMICCALWGSAFPCIKIGYRLFGVGASDSASQILFAGVRFFLAGILTILFGSIQAKHLLFPGKHAIGRILTLALFQTILQYTLFYMSLARTTAVNASIIDGTVWFFAILIAALVFHMEMLTMRKVFGCILGFAGIVLVSVHGASGSVSFGAGDILMLASAASSGMSTACLKLFSDKENPVVLSGYQFLVGGLVMILIGILMGGRLSPSSPMAFVLLLYMALISSVAYTVWGILLKYNPVSLIGAFGFMTPVFGVIFSALFAGEAKSLGIILVIALILVCAGIWQVQRAGDGKTQKSKTVE